MGSRMRREKDPLGEKEIPQEAYYGIQTARAIENFPISGIGPHREFIRATVMVKQAAAQANMETGLLDRRIGRAIVRASEEILRGKWHDHFVVDVFQAGAGTSHNMNANEVIANRAAELLGGKKGDYKLVHPNDHVNMSQSTNDVFPTAMRIATLFLLREFYPVLESLEKAFTKKAGEFDGVIKSGRTHLQDAVPVRLGQEFGAYALALKKARERIKKAADPLKELGIGGTAAGTGINTHPLYRKTVVRHLRAITGLDLKESESTIESMQSMADLVQISGALKGLAIELIRIANDLRLMSSGPRTGFAEILLPPVQPGSSIMPGKVNPVMAEALTMVAFYVVGADVTVGLAGQAGQLELNVMMPVINFILLQSLEILTNAVRVFAERCVTGIKADEQRCRELAEKSVGLATVLNPHIGYMAAAEIAKESVSSGKTIKEVLLQRRLLSREEAEEILNPYSMTSPRKIERITRLSEK